MPSTCIAEAHMGLELFALLTVVLLTPLFLFKGISLFGYRLIKPIFKSKLDVEKERADRKVQEFLELAVSERICPICRDKPMLPIFTSCGHVFCCPCILRHWCHSTGMETCLSCPSCRQEVPRLMPIGEGDPFKDIICDGCSDCCDSEDLDFDLSKTPASGDAQNREEGPASQESEDESEDEQAGDAIIVSSDGNAAAETSPLEDAMATTKNILGQLTLLKQSLSTASSFFLKYIDEYNGSFGVQSWSHYISQISVSSVDRLFMSRKYAAFCVVRLSILASIFNYLLIPFYHSSVIMVGAYAGLFTYFGVASMSIFVEFYLQMAYSHYLLQCQRA